MNYEFHAQYPLALKDSTTQAFTIDWLVEKYPRFPSGWEDLKAVRDPFARLMLLGQAIVTAYKEQARMGLRREKGGIRFWLSEVAPAFLAKQRDSMNALGLSPILPPLSILPKGSWALRFTFTLRKPYLSRDDMDFYIIDNPVKKEWVFKVPYVAPSQWKGALRAAMTRELVDRGQSLSDEEWVVARVQLTRLFGNEKGVGLDDDRFEAYLDRERPKAAGLYRENLKKLTPTGFLAGRLHFYPTFFDRMGLEVINPHPRETGAGKMPIYLECVPAGTQGTFALLYVPLDAGPADEDTVKTDLEAVARGLRSMFTLYGFGAKTSSGFGVAKEEVTQGQVAVNMPDILPHTEPSPSEGEPPDEAFLKYLDENTGEVKEAFRGSGEGGLMSNAEYKQKGQQQGGGSLSEFKKFRTWYLRHGKAWQESLKRKAPETAYPPLAFESFDHLCKTLQGAGGES